MRFKLDENLPVEVVGDRRDAGHEADSVHDEGIAGAPDRTEIERARSEGKVPLTLDKGIADVPHIRRSDTPVSFCFVRRRSGVAPFSHLSVATFRLCSRWS